MLSTEDFKTIRSKIETGAVDQLYVLQQLISAVIQDKISLAAYNSGLVEKAGPEDVKK